MQHFFVQPQTLKEKKRKRRLLSKAYIKYIQQLYSNKVQKSNRSAAYRVKLLFLAAFLRFVSLVLWVPRNLTLPINILSRGITVRNTELQKTQYSMCLTHHPDKTHTSPSTTMATIPQLGRKDWHDVVVQRQSSSRRMAHSCLQTE